MECLEQFLPKKHRERRLLRALAGCLLLSLHCLESFLLLLPVVVWRPRRLLPLAGCLLLSPDFIEEFLPKKQRERRLLRALAGCLLLSLHLLEQFLLLLPVVV